MNNELETLIEKIRTGQARGKNYPKVMRGIIDLIGTDMLRQASRLKTAHGEAGIGKFTPLDVGRLCWHYATGDPPTPMPYATCVKLLEWMDFVSAGTWDKLKDRGIKVQPIFDKTKPVPPTSP